MGEITIRQRKQFLTDVPSEIRELLDWYDRRTVQGSPPPWLHYRYRALLSLPSRNHESKGVIYVARIESRFFGVGIF